MRLVEEKPEKGSLERLDDNQKQVILLKKIRKKAYNVQDKNLLTRNY
jgi:hypothetical protein